MMLAELPHGEEARSAVSNHEAPMPLILRDAASRLLRMRGPAMQHLRQSAIEFSRALFHEAF
jgi:hypothetical protein